MRPRAIARWTLWFWSCGLVSLLGCEPRDQTPVGRGARIFQRTCSGCHGPDGRGTTRPGLTKPPRDLTRAEFHAKVTDDELLQVIRIGKGQMPAFGGLMAESDLRDVISFIRTLPPRPPTPPPGSPGPSPATSDPKPAPLPGPALPVPGSSPGAMNQPARADEARGTVR
jgi:cytochrome c553